MSDYEDLVARLRTLNSPLEDRFEAALAIEMLLRERDEARALNSINESGADKALNLLDSMKALCECHKIDRDAAIARAEKAEARIKLYESDDQHMSVTLALSRSNAWREECEKAQRERDALRALLREARGWLPAPRNMVSPEPLIEFLARIDAALKGGEDE